MSAGDEILAYLTSQQSAMVDLLKDLVEMESPSDDPASQIAIRSRLKHEFEQREYRVNLIPGRHSGGHLYARPKGSRNGQPAQLLLGHCDTVWPIGTLETMPIEIEGNIFKGPGVYDMKTGLVEILFAVQAINELGLDLTVAPICFINSDEEIGSRESTRYIRSLAQLVDRCMITEPSLGIAGKLKTARKGVGRFTIQVQGKAAHAGLDPTGGASAILELSHVIQTLFRLNNPERGISVNVGTIDGGVRANVIAASSSAVVDVRVETQEDARQIESIILNMKANTPGVSLSIAGGIGRPPMEKTRANQQLWEVARALADELGLELTEGTAGGGSDGNTSSLYTATLDGMGAVGDGAHAAHEFIYIDQLPIRCTLLTKLLLTPPLSNNLYVGDSV